MGFKVHFRQLAFQRRDPDNPVVGIGDPVIVKQGEDVPDWAHPAELSALALAGMILPVADPKDAPIVEAAAPAVANPEVFPGFGDSTQTPPPAAAEPVQRPKDSDTKPMWEAYAESIGIDRAKAESLTKPKLIEAVDAREAEIAEQQKAPAV